MSYLKASATLLACLLLSACFHTQLRGSVGGSVVSIAPLRSPNNILATHTSMTPVDWINRRGQEAWNEWSSRTRMLFVGVTQFEEALPALDPAALYVVSASGGKDFDPNSEEALSNNPTPVQGSWHVIATGQRIIDGNLKISALTEALYRQQLPRLATLTDTQIQDRLEAAAQLVVGDADESGSVDYDDVLRWNRSLDADYFLGELDALDALSTAITAGQPADMLEQLSQDVLGGQRVEMVFDAGTVLVETYNWESPITAANFLGYVRSGFYNQMLVHRAIDDFMIQMGIVAYDGRNEDDIIQWSQKTPGAEIINESNNGLSNIRGTLSMARLDDPDSARSQFFINQVNNTHLDSSSSNSPDGYAVFARVYDGMTVVDDIAAEPTTSVSSIGSNVPRRGVVLESVTLL